MDLKGNIWVNHQDVYSAHAKSLSAQYFPKLKIVKQIRSEVEQLNALSIELHNILKSRSNVIPDEGKTTKS